MNVMIVKSAILYMSIMVVSEGRLKSPAIDFDHENPSIEGDFNRPSDLKTNAQTQFLSKLRIAKNTEGYLSLASLKSLTS